MTGELTQKSSESESGASDREGYMDMLKTLERHEILEVLSQGFCRQCQSILHARIHRIVNSKNYPPKTPLFILFSLFNYFIQRLLMVYQLGFTVFLEF
jgi:hypothetical protein